MPLQPPQVHGDPRPQAHTNDVAALAGADDDAAGLGDRLAVANDLGADVVVVGLALLELGRAEGALAAGLDRAVVDVQLGALGQPDDQAGPLGGLGLLLLLVVVVCLLVSGLGAARDAHVASGEAQ